MTPSELAAIAERDKVSLAAFQTAQDRRALLAYVRELERDAEIGRIALRFVDRAGDTCEQDPAERICAEFNVAVSAAVELQRRVMKLTPQVPT